MSAEQESFERAATLLGVKQTTVSRRVAGLEEALRMKLFVRSPAGVELTDEGRFVFAKADPIRAQLAELRSLPACEKEQVAHHYWAENRVGRIMCRRAG